MKWLQIPSASSRLNHVLAFEGFPGRLVLLGLGRTKRSLLQFVITGQANVFVPYRSLRC
jgi:hypothetical protein